MRLLTSLLICATASASFGARPGMRSKHDVPAPAQSKWVHIASNGRLEYATTAQGDHIADFSYAGYRGGSVAIPDAPVAETLAPTGADDTEAMQAALGRVAERAAKTQSPQALLLAAGTFHLSAPILISASDVVLRGAGRDKTTLQLTGNPHVGLVMGSEAADAADAAQDSAAETSDENAAQATPHARTTLAAVYVPSGTRELPVIAAAGFSVGDTIRIKHAITPEYVHFMGMDHLERSGRQEHWVGNSITTERRIAAIEGNTLVLDVPLTDDYDPRFGGGSGTTVTAIAAPQQLHDAGVEALTIVAPAVSVALQDPHFEGIHITAAEDAWLRDLTIRDTTGFVGVGAAARRITIDRVDLIQQKTITSPAKPMGFAFAGTQTLVMRSSVHGDKIFFAGTQARMQGPNVLLDCDFTGDQAVEPHQRWSTGFLVDNVQVHGGGIHFINRGEMGSGHGWTIGWSVIWNSTADNIIAQQPPGSMNWVIGSKGRREQQPMPIMGAHRAHVELPDLPEATFDSWEKPVEPRSLYLQQLEDRLGPTALKNIGY